jgi:mannose-1-phosphate guanylyltransferase
MRGYYKIYPNLAKAGYGHSKLWMKFRKQLSFSQVVCFNEENQQEKYNQLLLNGGNVFCEGWNFRTPDEVISQYIPLYQEHFRPGYNTHWLDVEFLERPKDEVLVAVHVRRGDFKYWRGGKFYFGDEVYLDKIRQLTEQLDRPVKIILFSNDPDLDLPVYRKAFKNVLISGNGVSQDHYLMSKCDYIIGPFSTFSLWASFIGQTKFHHIFHEDDPVMLENFKIFGGNGTW